MHDFKLLRTTHAFGFAMPIAGVVMCVFWFGTVANLAGGLSPFFGSTNGNPQTYLWIATGLVLFGPLLNYIRRMNHLDANWQQHELARHHAPPFPYTDSNDINPAHAAASTSARAPSSDGSGSGSGSGDGKRPAHSHHHDITRAEFLVVVAVLLVGVLLPGLIFRGVIHGRQDAPLQDRLRLMSFNVQQQHTLDGFGNGVILKEALQDMQPSFVGFQEANSLLLLNGNFDLIDYLATYLRMASFAGVPPYRAGAGCAMLSHYDMDNVDAAVMPTLSGCSSCPLPNRMLVRSSIVVNGTAITIFDTHIEYFSSEAALQQVSYIRGLAAPIIAAGGAVVIMGDFNIPVAHPSLDPMFALGLTHAGMQHLGLPRNATFPRTEVVDDTHIDHIFYTANHFDLLSYVINDDGGRVSDHLAVYADFRLRI